MKIVIIGVGKIGLTLTGYLSREGNDVTLIDTDPKIIEEAVNAFDVIGIVGNGVNFSIQREAGVNRADAVIATTYSDEINMLCCIVAKKIGVRHTIARIRDPEYSKQFILLLDEMGLDMVVNPELEAAGEMSRLLRYPSAIGIDTFANGRVDLAQMKVTEDSPLDGLRVSEIQKRLDVRVLVCALQHEDQIIIPNGDNVIRAGDRIHFTSSHEQLAAFFKKVGAYRQKLRNVFIIGGGHIAFYLARQLLETGMSVKLIEIDERRCLELSELLPKAKIICGDGTDQQLLLEENFDNADACVATTGIDEENIIVSMYAKHRGVDKVITKISKSTLTDMLGTVGLDSVISPKQITANLILSYIRAVRNSEGSGVRTLYKLVDNRVEALEFHVSASSRLIKIPLRDLQLKENLLISCIIRENAVMIPGGNDAIEPGDNVIVTTTNEQLSDLDDILR